MYLSDLRSLYARPGPWVSVYLDASRDNERGAEEVGLRWRAAREALVVAGARQEILSEIERVISDDVGGEHGLAVFADPSGVAHVEALPRPPAQTSAEVGPLPRVTPMLEQRGEPVSWLRVVVDRTGADLETASEHRTIEGPERYPLSKNKPGGWSAPRYQQEAEVSWERNAGAVAGAAAEMAERINAEVLILAGDKRARQLVQDRLPKAWRGLARHSDGSRAPGASQERLDEQTVRAVEEIAQARVEDALDRVATHGTGSLSNVVAALRQGEAEAVLVEPSKLDDETLWVGPEPAYLAVTEEELRGLGVAEPQRVRADDALVRCATATGAELFLTPLQDEGAAAILRGST
jgi:hypothetical protein